MRSDRLSSCLVDCERVSDLATRALGSGELVEIQRELGMAIAERGAHTIVGVVEHHEGRHVNRCAASSWAATRTG